MLLKTLARAPDVHLALATSSHALNFRLKSSHQESFFSVFPQHRRVLGDDPRVAPGRGKPSPDIFFVALETINKDLRAKGEKEITPEECLVFEDSVPGVEAGRRAGMRVVWCPHKEILKLYRGLEEEVMAGIAHGNLDGSGIVGDGWAEMVKSLDIFVATGLAKYGIET